NVPHALSEGPKQLILAAAQDCLRENQHAAAGAQYPNRLRQLRRLAAKGCHRDTDSPDDVHHEPVDYRQIVEETCHHRRQVARYDLADPEGVHVRRVVGDDEQGTALWYPARAGTISAYAIDWSQHHLKHLFNRMRK